MAEGQKRSELGSIEQRGQGKWLVRVTVGTDPATGKQVRKSKTVKGSKREARRALNRLLEKYCHGTGPDMTYREYVESMYLPWHDAEYPREDAKRKLHYAMGQLVDEMGAVKLGDMTRARMELWAQQARPWKVDKMRASLRKAVHWELLERNPLDGVVKRSPAPERKRITEAQLADVLDAVHGSSIEPGVILQAFCGLRKAEALAIDWRGIDWKNSRVMIERTWHYDHGRGWFEDTKNASSRGWVSIPQAALQRLREIRDSYPAVPTGCLMQAPRSSGRMIPNTYSSIWKRLVKPVLGDDYIPVENLRHTHGSILADNGATIVEVKERLRHATTRVTERYYVNPDARHDAHCADIFDGVMKAN